MEEFKPGQVVSPGGNSPQNDSPTTPSAPTAPPQPERPVEQMPDVPPPAQNNEPTASAPTQTQEPAENWQFNPETTSAIAQTALSGDTAPGDGVSWTAAEFVAHDKSVLWYGALALVGFVAAALIYFLTKDKITASIIAIAFLAFGIFAARKPKEQQYAIDMQGLHVGQRSYSLQGFKSFSIAEDVGGASIVFMPLKRFMPALTIYLAPGSEDEVADYLSQLLPYEQHRQDAVDSLMKRIRF